MKPLLKYCEDRRPKTNISASDADKLSIDTILSLNGIEYSNPMDWSSYLRMSAGKGVELQMLKVLKQNGIVDEEYDQDFQTIYHKAENGDIVGEDTIERDSTKIERNGVTISMRFDAEVKKGGAKLSMLDSFLPQEQEVELGEGEPIEIKTINNKNAFDIQRYVDNKPRENYVKQLAIYMDALGKDQGHLFVSAIDGLNYFWFVCKKTGEGIYQCGETIVDLNKEYARFAELKEASKRIWDYPLMKKYWEEEKYKTPIDEIDWTRLSVSKIGDVRNGRTVVGSENKWKIDYSSYKDIIVYMQGEKLGYTDEEIVKIKELTAGFSAKPKTVIPKETYKGTVLGVKIGD